MRGVNRELWPWLRMTHPKGLQRLDQQPVPLNQRLFRSWLLVLGWLPVDYDDIGFEELDPGSGFVEVSTMLSLRTWRHERRIVAVPDRGCLLTDRLTFEPRIPGTGRIAMRIVRKLFDHRHARLRRRFGS